MRNASGTVFPTRVMNVSASSPGAATLLAARERAETDQAAFFHSFNPGNFEVGVKMVNACGLQAGHPLRSFWIFYSGLTNAATEVRAVDTSTGRVDVWRNPAGTLPTAEARTDAFPCP
jgi:hypothetical protein